MAKLATGVADAISCQLLVVGGATVGASASATLGMSSCPDLGAFVRLAQISALVAARRGGALPLLPAPW
jgi:hypothetical protein